MIANQRFSGTTVGLLGEVLRDLQAPTNRFFTDVL